MTLIKLFFIFMYIGFFAVGGGLVAASFMQPILVDKYALITSEKFYQMLAISESTPGPIGINMATYVGNELYGPLGGIITTIGEVLPSLIVILIVAKFMTRYKENAIVKSVFSCLRPATSGLVMVAMVNVYKIALLTLDKFNQTKVFIDLFPLPSIIFFVLALPVLFKTKLHPVFIIIAGAVFGYIFL